MVYRGGTAKIYHILLGCLLCWELYILTRASMVLAPVGVLVSGHSCQPWARTFSRQFCDIGLFLLPSEQRLLHFCHFVTFVVCSPRQLPAFGFSCADDNL